VSHTSSTDSFVFIFTNSGVTHLVYRQFCLHLY